MSLALALADAPVDWASTRLVAGVMLCVYLAVAVIQFGRESRFLAGVEGSARVMFILQDILIQLAVLLCLLPVTLAPKAEKTVLLASVSGMGLLWIVGIWTMITRRMYTYRLLLGAHSEAQKQIADLIKQRRESQEQQPESKDA